MELPEQKLEVLCKPDVPVNLFGFNPKYGVSGQRVRSVTYLPQGYHNTEKLYNKLYGKFLHKFKWLEW